MGIKWGSITTIRVLQESYDSVRREVLYNIFIVWVTHEISKGDYSKVCISKHLSGYSFHQE
jgi:hypothetical protein